ncbi:MAG: hypothetical protein K8J08_20720 [Thermoanaerobaculia bacterium]|nr:hypothetical protein [Thermoanaerobaculia bacterium]
MVIDFLVLCHADDRTALHVGASLRRRHGEGSVRVVSSDEVELAPRWAHRLEGGVTTTRLQLSDGTRLDSGRLGVVFNRLLTPRAPHFQAAGREDHGYAVMELYALWLSWLEGLPCPVMNAPSVWGLGTQRRSHGEWLARAAEAGLAGTGYRFTTDARRFGVRGQTPHRRVVDVMGGVHFEPVAGPSVGRRPCVYFESLGPERSRILVAGRRCVGPLGERFEESLMRLRVISGLDLFEVELCRRIGAGGPEWRLVAVDPFPRFEDSTSVAACVEMLETASRQVRS